MKRLPVVLMSSIFFLLFSAGYLFAQPAAKALVDDACSKCHWIKKVYSADKNAAEWEKTVDRMIKKGANIKPEDKDAVIKYLNTLNK